jgi:outer membrane murein-binding lipoprotein Lpp
MKTYRIITLFAAVLITVSLAGVISHERVGDPNSQSPIAATFVP